MNISLIQADQLTAEQLAVWDRLQRENVALESPCFRPEFTQGVDAVRGGVEVAVLEEKGETVGFFPFERTSEDLAQPVGGPLADYQGVVARQDLPWSATELLDACGLKAWSFNHLIASQESLQPYHYHLSESPYIDISRGFDAYYAELRQRGSREVKQTLRKCRKVEREIGPLRFVPHTTDPEVLETLIEWKRRQYSRTKVTNPFDLPWTTPFLSRAISEGTDAFSTMLSSLYIDDELVAVHVGLRSAGVVHGLSQSYNRKFAKFSPGIMLLVTLAQQAESLGLRRIEFGKGPEIFKSRLKTGATPLAVGSVDLRPLAAPARRALFQTRHWVLNSRLYRPARATARVGARVFPPLKGWLSLRGI